MDLSIGEDYWENKLKELGAVKDELNGAKIIIGILVKQLGGTVTIKQDDLVKASYHLEVVRSPETEDLIITSK